MSERLDQYFALEATEYLDQLEAELTSGEQPDLEQLLKLCKGVRGSAQMAGAESVAAVAERLEEGVRLVQGNHVVWGEEMRLLSLRTVADLKLLVRASRHWGEVEEERVRAAMERWDDVDSAPHGSPAPQAPREDQSSQPGAHLRADTPEVEVESLFYDDAGPHVLASEPEDDMDQASAQAVSEPVPIESLLLDRDEALREALAMRDELERAIRGVPGAELELAPTVRELFELLEIAAAGVASRG